eukprot:GHVU01231099.1.p1 GENE.GHVU01231099.1~~GHVU01231099.1.p1  ORF type:complete len:323 (+),score=32.70 GHVU01231099.1:69-971(+)
MFAATGGLELARGSGASVDRWPSTRSLRHAAGRDSLLVPPALSAWLERRNPDITPTDRLLPIACHQCSRLCGNRLKGRPMRRTGPRPPSTATAPPYAYVSFDYSPLSSSSSSSIRRCRLHGASERREDAAKGAMSATRRCLVFGSGTTAAAASQRRGTRCGAAAAAAVGRRGGDAAVCPQWPRGVSDNPGPRGPVGGGRAATFGVPVGASHLPPPPPPSPHCCHGSREHSCSSSPSSVAPASPLYTRSYTDVVRGGGGACGTAVAAAASSEGRGGSCLARAPSEGKNGPEEEEEEEAQQS